MLCASHLLTSRFRNVNCQVLPSTVLMQTGGTYIATWQDVLSRMSSLKLFVFIVTPSKQKNKQVWEGVKEFHYYVSLASFSIFRQGPSQLLHCLFFQPHTCVRPSVCPLVRFTVVIIVYNRKPILFKTPVCT